MSSEYSAPKKRRKRGEKENMTPSPESEGSTSRKRPIENSQSESCAQKKARSQDLQLLSQPEYIASDSNITAGKLIRVRLLNFMCHRNLVFTFGDKVNFISGKNGSGKSAILAALVLGLGGKTLDTNRGSSLTNLLKNGESRGAIEITISNQGALSYNHELYGNEITIVRNISGSSSSYKLLSEKGKLVSTKRSELQLILMYYNIQVNNPVTILNQDTSRSFLKSATPKDLYNLFRKGILLDEIECKLNEINSRKLPLINSLLRRKKQVYCETMKDLVEYSSKIDKYVELLKYQEEISNLQKSLAWAYVGDLEKKLHSDEESQAQIEANNEKLRSHIESRQGSESSLKEKLRTLEEDLLAQKGEIDAIDQVYVDLEQKVAYHRGIVSHKLADIKKLEKKIELEERRCRELKNEIDNSVSRSAEIEKQSAAMKQQKNSLIERCAELKAILSTTEVHKKQISDTVEELSKAVSHKEQYTANLARSIAQKQEYLKSLKSEKNELLVFSEWMPQLVAEIERAHQRRLFDHKPCGPFGRYIKLKERSWGPVVESLIGKSLKSFAVCSSRDLATMRKIFDKLNIPKEQRPAVMVTQFQEQAYDCSSTEVTHPNYKNLFRSIEVSNPVVANVLLDLYQIDTVLLVPTSRETYPLAEDERNVPRNCKIIVNKDGTKFYPSPNYRCYAGNVPDNSRYLQVSPTQAIRLTQQELNSLEEDYTAQKRNLDESSGKLKQEKTKLNDIFKELDTLGRQLSSCDTKLFELQQIEIPESFDVNILADDLQYRQSHIEASKSQLETLEKEKQNAMEVCNDLKSSWSEKNKEKEEAQEKAEKLEKELNEVKNSLRKYNTNHDHLKETLKQGMIQAEKHSEKIKHLKKELEDAYKTSTEMCPERIESEVPMPQLEKKIADLNYSAKALEKIVGKKPIEPADYKNRLDKYVKTVESLNRVSEGIEALTQNYRELVLRTDSILNWVFSSTRYSFSMILAKRNYVGEMLINHDKKTLTLNVKPDPNVQANTAITTLSGGERSYSMVAFIMSLWQNMPTPFFFLDEFDVFMDEVNRKLIMELLVSYAKAHPSNQFVFLTPHATSDLSTADVHFFRMEDPRAGNSQLSQE